MTYQSRARSPSITTGFLLDLRRRLMRMRIVLFWFAIRAQSILIGLRNEGQERVKQQAKHPSNPSLFVTFLIHFQVGITNG